MQAKFKLSKKNIKAQFKLSTVRIPAVFKINASGVSWGSIRGDITKQVDLQLALDNKADLSYVNNELSAVDNRIESIEDSLPAIEEQINNKPNRDELSQVAFSGDYNDLNTKPIIGNGTLSLLQNGQFVGNFSANAISNRTWNIDVPTKLSELENDIGSTTQQQIDASISAHNVNSSAHPYILNALNLIDDKLEQSVNIINSDIGSISQSVASNSNNITILNGNLNSLAEVVRDDYDELNENILQVQESLSSDLLATSNSLSQSIQHETNDRINADNDLQNQIDALTSSSDVVAIVGTYLELTQYDTSSLNLNDIIKVLNDEIHNGASSYYRWNGTSWIYIGSEGPYYTKSEANGTFVPQTRTINGKALNENITLSSSDVGALSDATIIGAGNLTIQRNGTNIGTFNANAEIDSSINIQVPTQLNDLSDWGTISATLATKTELSNAESSLQNNIDTVEENLTQQINLKQDKLIAGPNITIRDNVISSSGGVERYGIKGDYFSKYGIEYCQHGLIEHEVNTNNITIKGGMVLVMPNEDTKVTIGSDIDYTVTSTTDFTLFYVNGGNIIEALDVVYSADEPNNGTEGYIAWFNPEVNTWQFKSNDTGNVWRSVNATPLADIKFLNGNIVRIDYIGYRIINDDIFALKSDLENLSNITSEQLNNKLDLDLDNATVETKNIISGLPLPSDRYIDLTLGASGTTYTAPANGWFVYGANSSSCSMSSSTGLQTISNYVQNFSGCSTFIPVKKGDIVTLYYTGTADYVFIFVYAEGSESEAQ